MHDAGIRAARLNAVYIPLVLFFSTMAVAIVLLRGGYMVTQQILAIATLSTFTTYAVGIFEPIQMTAANIAEFISCKPLLNGLPGFWIRSHRSGTRRRSQSNTAMYSIPSGKIGSLCWAKSNFGTSPSGTRTAEKTCWSISLSIFLQVPP